MTKRLLLIALVAFALSGCSYMPSWLGGPKKEIVKLPGDRIAVLPAGVDLQPDAALKDVPITLPGATANADWPQHGSVTSGNLSAKGDFSDISSAKVGDGEAFERPPVPQPVIGAGMVFAMDGIGNISAHDAAHIETVKWNSKGLAEKDEPQIIGGGLAFDQGKLYAVSGRGEAGAFDALTGKELWRKNLHTPFRSAPTVAGDRLFVTTLDNQLYALNAATGEAIWSQRGISESAGIMSSVSPVVSGDSVIAAYSSGEIYGLSIADGREQWSDSLAGGKRTQASAFSGIGSDPVLENGVLFAVDSGGLITALTASTGQHIWDKPIGSINMPWLAGDYIFLLTTDNALVCLLKYDGRVRWSAKLPSFEDEKQKKKPIVWRGPVMVNGKLIVVSSNQQMKLISAADGKNESTKAIPEGVATAPIVVGGKMYLISQDATLYSLQ